MPRPKGIPCSEEYKKYLRRKLLGDKNPFYGREHTKEQKLKWSRKNSGVDAARYGMKNSEHQKTIVREYMLLFNPRKGKKGVLSTNWKGGVTDLYHKIRALPEYSLWTREVFIKDNFKCLKCGSNSRLCVHHKKAFGLILKEFLRTRPQYSPIEDKEILLLLAVAYVEFWIIKNGGTLCRKCHKKFHSIYGRRGDNTIEQFNEFIERCEKPEVVV